MAILLDSLEIWTWLAPSGPLRSLRPGRPRSSVACVYRRNHMAVVRYSYPVAEPVFAASRTSVGRWSIVAPGCRDLSARTGVRRIAVFDEPAAGGAEVIELEQARRERSVSPGGGQTG